MKNKISNDVIGALFTSALAGELAGASVVPDEAQVLDFPQSLTWQQCRFSKDIEIFVGIPEALASITVAALPKALEELGRKLSERTGLEISGPSILSTDPVEGCEHTRVAVATDDARGEILCAVPLHTLTFFESITTARTAPPGVERPVSLKPKQFEFLMGLDLPLKVSFGASMLPLSDILKLSVGSMVELNRRHDDPVDIVVNDRILARGEVVDVDGNYGVRVLEVCDWP